MNERDLKPANVFHHSMIRILARDPNAVLLATWIIGIVFASAYVIATRCDSEELGTLGYTAPEQPTTCEWPCCGFESPGADRMFTIQLARGILFVYTCDQTPHGRAYRKVRSHRELDRDVREWRPCYSGAWPASFEAVITQCEALR